MFYMARMPCSEKNYKILNAKKLVYAALRLVLPDWVTYVCIYTVYT